MANPEQYNLYNSTRGFIQYLMDEFSEKLTNSSGKCMDVGCGTGKITKNVLLPALDPNAVMIGIDISEDMIRYATKTYDDKTRLKFEVLDIETKNLPEKYVSEFDHVFSFYTLHWCNNIRLAFENIYHLLRPGGTILITMITYHNTFDSLYKLSQDVRYMPYITHMNNFIPPFNDSIQPHKEIKALLRSIGFDVLHCSLRERSTTTQETQRITFTVLSSITEFMKNMPHDLMEQFKNDYERECMEGFCYKRMRHQNEKMLSDIHEILVVYAQKNDSVQH